MNTKPLILIGGGGHCKSCIEVIETEGRYVIEGILDQKEKKGEKILDYTIIGEDDDIDSYIKKGYSFLITVGHIKTSFLRRKLYDQLKQKNASIATIISPGAMVSKHATIGEGTIIMHGAIVNAGVTIGENIILNTNCLIEHDAKVESHVHISTHAILNGAAVVEQGSFIGSNAVVTQGVLVGKDIIVGAGTVIISDLLTPGTYVGNPARLIK
ncbi:MAG TPA: acetyltransferase [Flavisolibacter sp.]|nr:acetyltransferase [Flavisolibacter sp.]